MCIQRFPFTKSYMHIINAYICINHRTNMKTTSIMCLKCIFYPNIEIGITGDKVYMVIYIYICI